MEKVKNLIVDFEFTGLDNEFKDDNEIIAMSILDYDNPSKKDCFIFETNGENTIGSKLVNKIEEGDATVNERFSDNFFEEIIKEYTADCDNTKIKLIGFGQNNDKIFLKKYNVNLDLYEWVDLQRDCRLIQKGPLNLEQQMLIHGASMEVVYNIITNKYITAHTGTLEVEAIQEIYGFLLKNEKNKGKYLKYMPWGFAKGMTIDNYTYHHGAKANGYMYNNTDLLSESLHHNIVESFKDIS